MPPFDKVIPHSEQAARAVDQHAPVHAAGRRVRLRGEEQEDEDDAHVADGADVDREAEPAEAEFGCWELLAAKAFEEDAGDAGDVGGEETRAGDCQDDVEGEGGLGRG